MNEREGILPASVVQTGFTQVVLVLPLPMCLKIFFASSANIKIGVLIYAVCTADNWKVFRLLWQRSLRLNPDLSRTQVIHFCLSQLIFHCADPNFVMTVTDPALAGGSGSPGEFLGGSSPGGEGGEGRGAGFHGNSDLTAIAPQEKRERCREHR